MKSTWDVSLPFKSNKNLDGLENQEDFDGKVFCDFLLIENLCKIGEKDFSHLLYAYWLRCIWKIDTLDTDFVGIRQLHIFHPLCKHIQDFWNWSKLLDDIEIFIKKMIKYYQPSNASFEESTTSITTRNSVMFPRSCTELWI